jgi:hypothetical protein
METLPHSSPPTGSELYYNVQALWDQLQAMKPGATGFTKTLHSILSHVEYSDFTNSLEGKHLVAFVDKLDTVSSIEI